VSEEQRGTTAAADPIRFLESALRAIVFGAGAYARTLFDFLFRPRAFDAEILGTGAPPAARRPYLRPLSYLLINLIFYFYVYPRREQGPTRFLIDASPAPISRALDRIEATLAQPDLPSILIVVGPLVLLVALHALLTARAFQLLGSEAPFETILSATCYAAGSLLAALALSAVVGASLTERAVAGTLQGAALAAYLIGMVVPFVSLFGCCGVRYVALVRAAAGGTWLRSIAATLAAMLILALIAGSLLAAAGMRVG
jgi:hypothetical protein